MKENIRVPQFDGPKPIQYVAVRVWLEDGTRTLGMWTGARWWSTKGEINPVRWELEVRRKKTEKLLKKLPKETSGQCAQKSLIEIFGSPPFALTRADCQGKAAPQRASQA